jgi:hypothetical protein
VILLDAEVRPTVPRLVTLVISKGRRRDADLFCTDRQEEAVKALKRSASRSR